MQSPATSKLEEERTMSRPLPGATKRQKKKKLSMLMNQDARLDEVEEHEILFPENINTIYATIGDLGTMASSHLPGITVLVMAMALSVIGNRALDLNMDSQSTTMNHLRPLNAYTMIIPTPAHLRSITRRRTSLWRFVTLTATTSSEGPSDEMKDSTMSTTPDHH
jgi:hypothetical protein